MGTSLPPLNALLELGFHPLPYNRMRGLATNPPLNSAGGDIADFVGYDAAKFACGAARGKSFL